MIEFTGTPAEVAIVQRLVGGVGTDSDIRAVYGNGSSAKLANDLARKYKETYNQLRLRAVAMGLLAPAAPRNREELEATQSAPSQQAPPTEKVETPEPTRTREAEWQRMSEGLRQAIESNERVRISLKKKTTTQ